MEGPAQTRAADGADRGSPGTSHFRPAPSHGGFDAAGQGTGRRWRDTLAGYRLDGGHWLLLMILALAAGLRFHALGEQPIWLDEGYSWWDARQSLLDLWRLVPQCDPHPPLYFVLLKLWIGLFGDGTLAMRALSASMSIATTAVIYLAGRQIRRPVGLVAALFFALTPFQIEFAHEARPYTLLCLGAALIVYGALRALRERSGWSGWIALGIGSVIVLWANNTAVLLVAAAVGGFALLMAVDPRMRARWPALFVVMTVVGLLWLPYLPLLFEQARGVTSDFWIQKPFGWRFTNELRFVVSLSNYEAAYWAVAALIGGAVLLWRRGYWRHAILLGVLGFAPIALNYLISISSRSIFIGRALIGSAPAMAILLAAAVMLIGSRRLRALALVSLIVAHALALVAMYDNAQGKEPWDRIAAQIVASMKEDGTLYRDSEAVVLTVPNELVLPLGHAMQAMRVQLPVRGAPADFPAPGLAARYPSGKCAPSMAGLDPARLAGLIRGRRSVYFITRANNGYDPGDRIAGFLRSQGLVNAGTQRYMPGFLEVHKFVVPANRPAFLVGADRPPATGATNAGPAALAAIDVAPASVTLVTP